MKKIKIISCLLSTVLVVGMLSGCGSSSVHQSADMAMVDGAYGGAPMMFNSASKSLRAESSAVNYSSNTMDTFSTSSGSSSSEGGVEEISEKMSASNKIIYRGSLRVHTSDMNKTEETVVNKIEEYNGYISNYEKDDNSYVRINARIPSENFDKMINDSDIAKDNSVSKNMSAEDVTLTYSDIEAEMESLKVQEERLLTYLQSAANVEEMMSIENTLQDVREELGKIGSRLKYLDSYIEYSELEIYISARYIAPNEDATFGEKIKIAFQESLDNIQSFFTSFVIGIVYNWPTLLIWALIIVFGIKIIKKRINKKKMKKLEKEQNNKEEK